MNNVQDVRIFASELWDWFERHKRTLPWRDLDEKNLDHKAYLILVSEVMLQQTQVSRVIVLYKKFIQLFPRIEDLSKASNSQILIAWRGLGYNNRALRLRDAAREIVQTYGGKFPREMDELQKLPGVGHYTAGAIRNFAFGIPTPCMDVNIRRILHRFFIGPENPDGTWKKSDRELLPLSEEVMTEALAMKKGSSADFFAALMDFGSLVCTKNNPKWDLMSKQLQSLCMAYGKEIKRTKKVNKKEPGRMMAGRFVPNRIFRGKIVDALRDAPNGLPIKALGAQAIADWSMGDHHAWLMGLLEKLKGDGLLQEKRGKYALKN